MVVNFMLRNGPASNFTQTLPKLCCFLIVKYGIIYIQKRKGNTPNENHHRSRSVCLAHFIPVYALVLGYGFLYDLFPRWKGYADAVWSVPLHSFLPHRPHHQMLQNYAAIRRIESAGNETRNVNSALIFRPGSNVNSRLRNYPARKFNKKSTLTHPKS